MVELIEICETELPPTTAQRAIVLEDKTGSHDHERLVTQDTRGHIFFWSNSSIQADRQSTIAMAMRWAAEENLEVVYLVR